MINLSSTTIALAVEAINHYRQQASFFYGHIKQSDFRSIGEIDAALAELDAEQSAQPQEEALPVHEYCEAAWELSAWAACINWDGSSNESSWLDGLESRIERTQELARQLDYDKPSMMLERDAPDGVLRYGHRNGEATDPEIGGHYFVEFVFEGEKVLDVWEWANPKISKRWGIMPQLYGNPIRIYGPIPLPTDAPATRSPRRVWACLSK